MEMRRVKQDRDVTSSYERGSLKNHTDDASITRSRRGKQDDAGRSNLAQRRTEQQPRPWDRKKEKKIGKIAKTKISSRRRKRKGAR